MIVKSQVLKFPTVCFSNHQESFKESLSAWLPFFGGLFLGGFVMLCHLLASSVLDPADRAPGKFASSKSTRTEGCVQPITLGLRKSRTGEDVISSATRWLLRGLWYGCRTHTWSWKDSYLDRGSMFCLRSTAVSSTGRVTPVCRSFLEHNFFPAKKDFRFLLIGRKSIHNHSWEIYHFFLKGTKWKQLHQDHFVKLLGFRLQETHGIPMELWLGRVRPCLLPRPRRFAGLVAQAAY